MKRTIRPYIREKYLAEVATRNFLAAFGVYLGEQGWNHDEVLAALTAIDGIMDRDDNVERLEQMCGIRLDIKG